MKTIFVVENKGDMRWAAENGLKAVSFMPFLSLKKVKRGDIVVGNFKLPMA